jgi:hypothetical protein
MEMVSWAPQMLIEKLILMNSSSCGLGISALPEHGISSSVPLVSAEASRGYATWAKRVHYRTFALDDGSGLSRPIDDVWPDEFFDTL